MVMANNVQDLINKIKLEGFNEAEKNAKAIEDQAKEQAQEIIDQAKAQADKILAEAKEAIAKFDQASKAGLEQAARNVLLTLKQDIQDLLRKVIAKEVQQAVSGEKLVELVSVVSKNVAASAQIALNQQDLEMLKVECFNRLEKEIKSGVTFVSRRDRSKGLTISFDQQKSCFDLTEEALVEYFASFVNEELASIIRKS